MEYIFLILLSSFWLMRNFEKGNAKSAFDAIASVNKNVEEERRTKGFTNMDTGGGKLIEGDVQVFNDDPYLDKQQSPGQKVYGVLSWPRRLWRTRKIPYEILHSGTSKLTSYQARDKILEGLKEIQRISCITFRPWNGNDRNWIRYVKGSGGCFSSIGRQSSKNTPTIVHLGENCVHQGIIIHETLHALGFYHEQSRRDRDAYVNVYLNKVISSMQFNFDKQEEYAMSAFGQDYDYKSILHYGKTSFTIDGSDTMVMKEDPNTELGGNVLSRLDESKINTAYHCHDGNRIWTEWSGWSICVKNYQDECKRSKHRICLAEDLSNCPTANEYGIEAIVQDCTPPLYCKSKYAVDGYYGSWTSWSSCSVSCGFGKRTKTRKCVPPRDGGYPCVGHSMETELCRVKRCGPRRSIDSNFENGWNGWKNMPGNDVNWKIGTGKTAFGNTGPKADHSSGNGYYVYLPSNWYLSDGKKGTLVSGDAGTKSGKKCLRFHYMMNGKHMGRLSVYLKEHYTNKYYNMMDKKGHQSNKWISAAFTLPVLPNYFNVFIEAKIGYSSHSDFAIDDIYLDPVPCPLGAHGCKDNDINCKFWGEVGECERFPVWMLQACCATCRVAPLIKSQSKRAVN